MCLFILYSEVFGRLWITECLCPNKLLIDPLLIYELCIAIFNIYLFMYTLNGLVIHFKEEKKSNGDILALIQIVYFTSEESHS